MKKSYKFIFVAIGLVVTGFVMDEIFDYVPFSTNPQLTNVFIEPNSDYFFKINSKGETKMSGVVSSTNEIPFSLKVLDHNEGIIWESNSISVPSGNSGKKTHVIVPEFFNPNSKGSIDIVITNLGNQQVMVSGGIHDKVDQTQYTSDLEGVMDVFFEIFWYTILSFSLKFVGIIVGIVGGVFFFKEQKSLKKVNFES